METYEFNLYGLFIFMLGNFVWFCANCCFEKNWQFLTSLTHRSYRLHFKWFQAFQVLPVTQKKREGKFAHCLFTRDKHFAHLPCVSSHNKLLLLQWVILIRLRSYLFFFFILHTRRFLPIAPLINRSNNFYFFSSKMAVGRRWMQILRLLDSLSGLHSNVRARHVDSGRLLQRELASLHWPRNKSRETLEHDSLRDLLLLVLGRSASARLVSHGLRTEWLELQRVRVQAKHWLLLLHVLHYDHLRNSSLYYFDLLPHWHKDEL